MYILVAIAHENINSCLLLFLMLDKCSICYATYIAKKRLEQDDRTVAGP